MHSTIGHGAALASLFMLVASLGSCAPTEAPAPMQTARFAVVETLTTDTCGPQGAPVQSTVNYNADLGVQNTEASWQVVGNGGRATGQYADGTRSFRFTAENVWQVRAADATTGRPACVMRRLDVLDGTLSGVLSNASDASDAGIDASADSGEGGEAGADGGDAEAPPSFVATESVVYGPVAGADCTGLVGASDGQYLALPCEQRFSVLGRTAP